MAKPNILFITCDYQSGEDGPSLGSPFLDMPALDRLCRHGVVCERHYSTAPICMPERYSWVSGQYPHTHGQWSNMGSRWLPEGTPILMEELVKGGYYTLGIGKMHFAPWDRLAGFSRRIIADCKCNYEGDAHKQDDYAQCLEKRGFSRMDYLGIQYDTDPPFVFDSPLPEDCHIDHYVGTQTRQVIENGELDDRGPWFAWMSFNGPHNPWDPPKAYAEPYMKMDLPQPRMCPDGMEAKPIGDTRARYGYTRGLSDYIDRYPDKADWALKKLRAGHYGGLTFIDRQVAGVLNALEQKGQLDSTIVIWSADHGSNLGDHGSFHKGSLYDRSVRVPFVVHCPDRYKPRRTGALCAGVDLTTTLLSLAGVPVPEAMEGTDMTPLFTGEKESIKDKVIIELGGNVGIITDRWKLACHCNGERELYDIETDPNDLNNLHDDPGHTAVQKDLEQQLAAFHPEVAKRMDVPPPVALEEKSEYHFAQGTVLNPGGQPQPPVVGGKDIHLSATITPVLSKRERVEGPENQPLCGPVIMIEEAIGTWPAEPQMHGCVLYVKNNKLSMAIRHWNEDSVVVADSDLPDGPVKVEGMLAQDGNVTLKVNGEVIAEDRAPGSIPLRPGRKEATLPFVHVGVGHGWGTPIGDCDYSVDFNGNMTEVTLKTG